MEVGAVKQAFNNEVILLKKKLNQAKIQVIHKLTRKAKTLTEKKAPENLKEKLKRKAESAVKEVLIIKKIKPKDIAKFIITHTGKINDYLNKPQVDIDKACARLVLHKALQDKYTFMRNRFGNIPIKDLFMSRQERRKLKKEQKEKQKNKKGKDKTNQAGEWNVEDIDAASGDENNLHSNENSDIEMSQGEQSDDDHSNGSQSDNEGKNEISDRENSKNEALNEGNSSESQSDSEEVGKLIKIKPEIKPKVKSKPLKTDSTIISARPEVDINELKTIPKLDNSEIDKIITVIQQKKQEKKPIDKKAKENKNKNLKDKLQNRKFKKDDLDDQIEGKKVVDPFFITSTGENYLSLAEPRLPDEVKEVHKQGNRQERRAAMFGRKYKPRNNIEQNNFRSNKFDNNHDDRTSSFGNSNDRFGKGSDLNYKRSNFNARDSNNTFNNRDGKFNNRNDKFNDKNDRFNSNFNSNRDDKKDEKLHPSWEAKRKLKAMPLLPPQGKKIVFDN